MLAYNNIFPGHSDRVGQRGAAHAQVAEQDWAVFSHVTSGG